jgi:hypothetical protein
MRVVTRVEDIAYYLLGIFSVHMLMLYSEGDYVFIRQKEEVIRTSIGSNKLNKRTINNRTNLLIIDN